MSYVPNSTINLNPNYAKAFNNRGLVYHHIQLPSYLPRLLGAVEPLQGFFSASTAFDPPSVVSCPAPFARKITSALPRPHRGQSGNREPNRAPKPDRQKQRHDERCAWGEPWDRIAWRCIRVKSPRMTAGRNSGVVRRWHYVVVHGPVLSAPLLASELCRSFVTPKCSVNHVTAAVKPDGPRSPPFIYGNIRCGPK
jgi:hypothetical protein